MQDPFDGGDGTAGRAGLVRDVEFAAPEGARVGFDDASVQVFGGGHLERDLLAGRRDGATGLDFVVAVCQKREKKLERG